MIHPTDAADASMRPIAEFLEPGPQAAVTARLR
jgi:hypothetical protein